MKKKFEVQHWLQKSEPTVGKSSNSSPVSGEVSEGRRGISDNSTMNDVEIIIQRLEESHSDITANYSDWRDIGFSFADEFGEAGRDYFHRASRFYPEYSQTVCDKQFDNCLKAKGHGVTIKTFFHLAQQAGISLVTTQPKTNPSASKRPDGVSQSPSGDLGVNEETIFNTPRIPTELYSQLPEILRESCEMFADAIEKDVFLIGTISV
ncbi:MAG: hypothetical protein GX126_15850, partial [Bacteroidales bacterium]|nr:hypothetical protein [Bacteroidales bacterium]